MNELKAMLTFEIPLALPKEYSPNWRGHWAARYAAGIKFQSDLWLLSKTDALKVQAGTSFPLEKATLQMTLVFRQKRARDDDNTIAMAKPLIDFMVKKRWLSSDRNENLTILKPLYVVDRKRAPLLIVELT